MALALTGAAIAGYLTYTHYACLVDVQLVVIGAACKWCVASDVETTAITALALARLLPFSLRRQVETPT